MLNKERLEKVLSFSEAPQLLITDPYAVYYLTGKLIFPGERFYGLLITEGKLPVLYVNELFRFDEEIGIEKVYIKDVDQIEKVLAGKIDPEQLLGVDKNLPARFLLPMMDAHVAKGYVNGSLAVDRARAIKNEEELVLMRKASLINDQAMAEFRTLIHEGVTEIEAAEKIPAIYKKLGAEGCSFEPIVAFGVNAADPHHMPDETVVKEGDAVLFDVGCRYQGYCSDMTRTFFYMKEPDEKQKKIYDLVRNANEKAEEAVKAGVPLCSIDSVARDIITDGGYGSDFTHRLGHFIGIEVHEYGDVSQAFETLTETGNVFSIEPGIYHPSILGCRIEDLVVVTKSGCEVLNHYPKGIEVIGRSTD